MGIGTTEEKEEQRKQTLVRFVNAAQQVINQEGLENASIRKIALAAGFHNSTIYLYFQDLDHLIMLASVKYFSDYSHALYQYSKMKLSPNENFLRVWDFFEDATLKNPKIFYNFFFGKRSNNLRKILNQYYDLFPEEKEEMSGVIESMYYGNDIMERSLLLLQSIIPAKNQVTEENIEMINDIIVGYCKYKLELKCMDLSLSNKDLKEQVVKTILFITGISSNS